MVAMPIGLNYMDMIGMTEKEHQHYMAILIKHNKERTCWNDRINYWEQYNAKR